MQSVLGTLMVAEGFVCEVFSQQSDCGLHAFVPSVGQTSVIFLTDGQ